MGFDFSKYKHIILIGSPGSGKSWLSKRIAEITGYPLFHLDKEYHLPNWERPPKDEWIAKQKMFIGGEKWIIDGNYNSTIELRFSAADLVIFMDINRLVCIWSAAKRTRTKRSDLPNYLEEPQIFSKKFFEFCKDTIWKFRKSGRKTIIILHEKYPEKEFLHIKSRRKVKSLLMQ